MELEGKAPRFFSIDFSAHEAEILLGGFFSLSLQGKAQHFVATENPLLTALEEMAGATTGIAPIGLEPRDSIEAVTVLLTAGVCTDAYSEALGDLQRARTPPTTDVTPKMCEAFTGKIRAAIVASGHRPRTSW